MSFEEYEKNHNYFISVLNLYIDYIEEVLGKNLIEKNTFIFIHKGVSNMSDNVNFNFKDFHNNYTIIENIKKINLREIMLNNMMRFYLINYHEVLNDEIEKLKIILKYTKKNLEENFNELIIVNLNEELEEKIKKIKNVYIN